MLKHCFVNRKQSKMAKKLSSSDLEDWLTERNILLLRHSDGVIGVSLPCQQCYRKWIDHKDGVGTEAACKYGKLGGKDYYMQLQHSRATVEQFSAIYSNGKEREERIKQMDKELDRLYHKNDFSFFFKVICA